MWRQQSQPHLVWFPMFAVGVGSTGELISRLLSTAERQRQCELVESCVVGIDPGYGGGGGGANRGNADTGVTGREGKKQPLPRAALVPEAVPFVVCTRAIRRQDGKAWARRDRRCIVGWVGRLCG